MTITLSIIVTALSLEAAPGLPAADAPETMPIGELKSAYLACEREAQSGPITTARIRQCSLVYEVLKHRAFGGEFRRIRAWTDGQIGRVAVD